MEGSYPKLKAMKTKNVTAKSSRQYNLISWWRRWWKRQGAAKQDRFREFGTDRFGGPLLWRPLLSLFGYLRIEEIDREQEAVRRDVEYGQQRLRLQIARAAGASNASGQGHFK
jgi:hypothetical protein